MSQRGVSLSPSELPKRLVVGISEEAQAKATPSLNLPLNQTMDVDRRSEATICTEDVFLRTCICFKFSLIRSPKLSLELEGYGGGAVSFSEIIPITSARSASLSTSPSCISACMPPVNQLVSLMETSNGLSS